MNFEIELLIQQLINLQVDGETMQYILQKTGMEDQMLRQLIMSKPFNQVKDLVQEKLDTIQMY
jgi:hypothetical protein